MSKACEQDVRNISILLSAAVRSSGGRLVIYDSDIVRAGADEVTRFNDSANRRVVLTLYDDYPDVRIRNPVYGCTECGYTGPALLWDEVWSHGAGTFIGTSCPACHAFRKTMCVSQDPDWMQQVELSGIKRAIYTSQRAAQRAEDKGKQ